MEQVNEATTGGESTDGAALRVELLGGFACILKKGSVPLRVGNRKARALLAILAMAPRQAAMREQLATLLWSDSSDQQARQSLRQTLHLLRKELLTPDCLSVEAESVSLTQGVIGIDVLDFFKAAESLRDADLRLALALFQGEFLAGFTLEGEAFEEWLRVQRERIHLVAAKVIGRAVESPGLDGSQVVAAAERLHALDPLREDWHRLVLKAYARHQGTDQALARAAQFRKIVEHELGAEPEPATRALIKQIGQQPVSPLAGASSGDPGQRAGQASPPTPSLPRSGQASQDDAPAELGARVSHAQTGPRRASFRSK